MASKQIKISDVFEQSCCGVCGYEDINQYFSVNENFVEYLGVYVSLREILRDSLDIKVKKKKSILSLFFMHIFLIISIRSMLKMGRLWKFA